MENISPRPLIDELKRGIRPRFNPEYFRNNPSPREWEDSFRSSLEDAFALPPRGTVPGELVLRRKEEKGEYRQQEYAFTCGGREQFPLAILTPRDAAPDNPVVLAFSGHGPGISAMIGEYEEEECHHYFGRSLVRAGFTVVMPEIIGFGGSRLEKDRRTPGEVSCRTLASELLTLGYTLAGLRLRQGRDVLDMIEARYGTDRLGCFGFSGGGLLGYALTALDSRIRALGLSGYCSTFDESILRETHCLDNYIPGLYRICDQPEIARLIHPRPLYIEAGREDRVFPFTGALAAKERIEACYGGEGTFVFQPLPGGHEIDGRKMIDWYKEVLQ